MTSAAISKCVNHCSLVLCSLVDLDHWCKKHRSGTEQGPDETRHLHKVGSYSFLVM